MVMMIMAIMEASVYVCDEVEKTHLHFNFSFQIVFCFFKSFSNLLANIISLSSKNNVFRNIFILFSYLYFLFFFFG